MKAKFTDFFTENPMYKQYEGDKVMEAAFNLLSEDSSIAKMIEASNTGIPALAPVASEIEDLYYKAGRGDELNIAFLKQGIGKMVKTILYPFGYVVIDQKPLPENAKAKHFYSASIYELDSRK